MRKIYLLVLLIIPFTLSAEQNTPKQCGWVTHFGTQSGLDGFIIASKPCIPSQNSNIISLTSDWNSAFGNVSMAAYIGDGTGSVAKTKLCSEAGQVMILGYNIFPAVNCAGITLTAGNLYYPVENNDNSSAGIHNYNASQQVRSFQTDTYPTWPATLSVTSDTFNSLSEWMDIVPVSPIITGGWPAPLNNLPLTSITANTINFQKFVPTTSGTIVDFDTWVAEWTGSVPHCNQALYDSDGAATGVGSDTWPKTLLCNGTSASVSTTVNSIAVSTGWIAGNPPTTTCHYTSGHLYWIGNNCDQPAATELCSSGLTECDSTMGTAAGLNIYYATISQTYGTFTSLTSDPTNNTNGWYPNMVDLMPNPNVPTQIGAFIVGP